MAQARGDLGSTSDDCRSFHFPLFLPHDIKIPFISSVRQDVLSIYYQISTSGLSGSSAHACTLTTCDDYNLL